MEALGCLGEQIQNVQVTQDDIDLKASQNKFPNCFKPGIGCIPNTVHRIILKEDVIPKVIPHPRPVDLSRREAVDAEIDRLDSEGITSPVDA